MKKKKQSGFIKSKKAKKGIREPAAPKKCTTKSISSQGGGGETSDGDSKCQNEDNTSTKASTALLASYADTDQDIRSSLYTHDTEEDAVPPSEKPFPYRPLQRYTSNIKNYMAERYLDSMYLDKIFLEKLSEAPGITSPNKEGTKKILKLCKTGYKNLSYKQVCSNSIILLLHFKQKACFELSYYKLQPQLKFESIF